MSLIVLASPGGSPGVTTTALALALAWPRQVVLAECDPAGGSVLSGLWRGQPPAAGASAGLLRFALLAQQDPDAAAASLCEESVPLSARPCRQFVLPAPAAPLAGRQIATAWPALAAAFAAAPADVIADAGRLDGHTPLAPLLATADAVLMVCRPLIRQAAAAQPRLEMLASVRGGYPPAELVLVGDGPYGLNAPRVLSQALEVPVRGSLPGDPDAAGVLSDGAAPARFGRSPLMRAAAALAAALAAEHAPRPAGARLPAGAGA
jgi:hypothetical protein